MKNALSFMVYGRYALFTDPITRMGGEKCSYHIPTYEALKGICKSIYWKPSFIWVVDKVRIMYPIRTQTKGVKWRPWEKASAGLSIYTYLADVCYQVRGHFVWNAHRSELAQDRIDGKHFDIAKRMLARGGRQDIFLGTRECQAYVEPCTFGEGEGAYDDVDELSFGLMFHGFDYPDETGVDMFQARFWHPTMRRGVIDFAHPDDTSLVRKPIRPMKGKQFVAGENYDAGDALTALPDVLDDFDIPDAVTYPHARQLFTEKGGGDI